MGLKKNNSLDRCNEFVSNSGDRIRIKYRPKFDTFGRLELVEDGKEDWYAYIQSFKDSVDINKMVQRYANGEIDIFNQIPNVAYGDVSQISTNRADILNEFIDAQRTFELLPPDVKQMFDNSFETWFIKIGDPGFVEQFNQKKDAPVEESDSNE